MIDAVLYNSFKTMASNLRVHNTYDIFYSLHLKEEEGRKWYINLFLSFVRILKMLSKYVNGVVSWLSLHYPLTINIKQHDNSLSISYSSYMHCYILSVSHSIYMHGFAFQVSGLCLVTWITLALISLTLNEYGLRLWAYGLLYT